MRQLPVAHQPGAQRLPFDEGHHVEEVLTGRTGVEERDDGRMVEPRRDLAEKAGVANRGNQRRPHHLDRHQAAVFDVFGEVDRRHPAAAELTSDPVSLTERRGFERGENRVSMSPGMDGAGVSHRSSRRGAPDLGMLPTRSPRRWRSRLSARSAIRSFEARKRRFQPRSDARLLGDGQEAVLDRIARDLLELAVIQAVLFNRALILIGEV